MIITIDGPAGAGKSTIARQLSRRLNFAYLDTGAMYRALTLKALRANVDLNDEDALVELARRTTIDLKDGPQAGWQIFLDGVDVSLEIRSLVVTNHTFYIARAPRIREIMVGWQRQIGQKADIVVEGRDVGTVVFPNATVKFYLDADFAQRSQRRISELREQGKFVEEEKLKKDLQDRDHKDLTRSVGPLRKADDAILIDSTHLTIEQVLEEMIRSIKS